jgi:hypothetical protein
MRERAWLAAAAAAAAILTASVDVSAQTGARVGLVVATHVNLNEAQADALASRLGEAIVGQLDVDVIAGVEARRRLPVDGIAEDCVARPACVRDVATRLDGDELLFLFIVRVGRRLQIDVTWVEARTGTMSSRSALVIDESPNSNDTAERVFAEAPRGLLPNAAPRRRVEASPTPTLPAASDSMVGELSSDMPVPGAGDRPRRGRRFTVPVIVTGAVAAAALATGVGFAVAARQDYDSLEADGCAEQACSGVDDRIDRMERRALAADVLFAGAGAAAVTSLILYITSDGPERGVRFGATEGGGVVSLAGRF